MKQAYIAYEVIKTVGIASSCRPMAYSSVSVSCWPLYGIHMPWEQLEESHPLYESASPSTSPQHVVDIATPKVSLIKEWFLIKAQSVPREMKKAIFSHITVF